MTETVGMSKVLVCIMRDFSSVWAMNVAESIVRTVTAGSERGVMDAKEML